MHFSVVNIIHTFYGKMQENNLGLVFSLEGTNRHGFTTEGDSIQHKRQ